jgi:hypothetical protein
MWHSSQEGFGADGETRTLMGFPAARQTTSYVVSMTGSANAGKIQHTTQVTVTVE